MDASPSIRSSYRPAQGVNYTQTKSVAHEALQKLANNCLHGMRIYQPFQGEKALIPLSRGVFYALVHQNPVDTGFLIFSPRHTPVYLHESFRRSLVVRMRLSSKMHEQTAIMAVSLDKSDGYLWLEDVLVWDSQTVHETMNFTERRKIMNQFLEHHWMPDARAAGGLQIRVANYVSLEDVSPTLKEVGWSAIDLCPELPGRRRFRIKAAGGTDSSLVAEIRPVSGLPDVYELWSAEEQCVGRAAIQEMSMSREIRERFGAGGKLYVEVVWNPNFEKFRIQRIVSTAVPRSPAARFTQSMIKLPVEEDNEKKNVD
jgi:hypothetical protein